MLGMGVIFSIGIGVIASLIAVPMYLLNGHNREVFLLAAGSAVWAFPIGVAFSAVLALTRRGRAFDKLSIPLFALIGAGAGLLLYGVLALNAWHAWSASAAIANAVILVSLGAGAATSSLRLARRAVPALGAGDEVDRIGDGE
jgi:hypothetical protein